MPVNNKFEIMSDVQLDEWMKDILRKLQNKQARERAYILSQRGKPGVKSRSFKKLVKEHPALDEVIEYLEYCLGGESSNGSH